MPTPPSPEESETQLRRTAILPWDEIVDAKIEPSIARDTTVISFTIQDGSSQKTVKVSISQRIFWKLYAQMGLRSHML